MNDLVNDKQLIAIVGMIRSHVQAGSSIEEATQSLLEAFGAKAGDPVLHTIERARAIVAAEMAPIEILRNHSIFRKRTDWYTGPSVSSIHWPALKSYLANIKKRTNDEIESADQTSNEIVSLIENPFQAEYSCRGLVVGYVQSGKTANMTAVIAKSVDAGYNLVIILAGLTDKLREQTQGRLESDLVELRRDRWSLLTGEQDYREPPNRAFTPTPSTVAQLAIVKKNTAPLGQLISTIQHTPPHVLRTLKVLIIDDECDQASVNAANRALDITAINRCVRTILSRLPCVTYIGYTATPFANVLINPFPEDPSSLDDLYPRDFITALPRADAYFGTEQLFGRSGASADEMDDEFNVIRIVPQDDEKKLKLKGRNAVKSYAPEIPKSLEEAILWFLLACCVRRARGQANEHMSMLVHTSPYVRVHVAVSQIIKDWVAQIRPGIEAGRPKEMGRLRAVWTAEAEAKSIPPSTAQSVSFEAAAQHLPEVLKKLEFPVENGASTDLLDFSSAAKTYIVVGGSILARGLTIDGLMVSYFIRSASQYDTLLQMGRWFGFRKGYEDLPRIWMPQPLATSFRALAQVEHEVREDIGYYRLNPGQGPMDFAVRIRSIPGMAITAAAKMRAAEVCGASYWGRHVQTIRFAHRDPLTVESNWRAGHTLLEQSEAAGHRQNVGDKILYLNVPQNIVVDFLRAYDFEKSHHDLAGAALLAFLESEKESLSVWNVGVIQTESGRQSTRALGPSGKVRLSSRTRLSGTDPEIADIKALMSRTDVLFDTQNTSNIERNQDWESLKRARVAVVGEIPLLLLYPIDKGSTPIKASYSRTSLDSVDDLLGAAIIFPGSRLDGGKMYRAKLKPLAAEDLAEIEAEESAAMEGAGVSESH